MEAAPEITPEYLETRFRECVGEVGEWNRVRVDRVWVRDGHLYGRVLVSSLDGDEVIEEPPVDQILVDARHRSDRVRLDAWLRQLRWNLEHGWEYGFEEILFPATTVVDRPGGWRARPDAAPPMTLRRLPAWARATSEEGASIVHLPDRDAVLCVNEDDVNRAEAEQAGYGIVPLSTAAWPDDSSAAARARKEEAGKTRALLAEADQLYEKLQRPPRASSGAASREYSPPEERVAAWLFVPARSEPEALIALRFGGFNLCPGPAMQAALLRHWGEQYGATLRVLTRDLLCLDLGRPPETADDVAKARAELEVLAADESPTDPRASSWRFWWD